MAEPEADRRDVDEAEEAFGGLVIAGGDASGVLQLVEAPLDQVAPPIELAVDGDVQLSALPHRYDRHDVACFHGSANVVRVIAPIRQQDGRLGQVVGHDEVEAPIVRRLAGRDLGSHGQACRIDAQMDLGREATSRTAETLARSPPFAPAA